MAVYSGMVPSIAASTTDDNWTLAASANESCRILAVNCSGEVTTSAAMATKWTRSTGQNGATTAGNVEKAHPNHVTNTVEFATTYATTQPTLNSGALLQTSWNAHGGIFYWHAGAPDEEWVLIGAATNVNISSRQTVGTSTSSYGVIWRED